MREGRMRNAKHIRKGIRCCIYGIVITTPNGLFTYWFIFMSMFSVFFFVKLLFLSIPEVETGKDVINSFYFSF